MKVGLVLSFRLRYFPHLHIHSSFKLKIVYLYVFGIIIGNQV